MAQQTMTGRAGVARASAGAAPEAGMRIVGALLALGVAAAHVADQGGVTAFTSPDWIGWGYRLIEVGGVLAALAMLLPWPAGLGRPWLRWAAAVLLGAGPFIAYVASRTAGVPGDPGDVGNWGDWVGTVSLFVEAALVLLSASMLLALRHTTVTRMVTDYDRDGHVAGAHEEPVNPDAKDSRPVPGR
ncbi:MAG TPA: hypothetical protein VK284_06955 [Streptosporangiaceae bacterium]|nr:hypothetical protein [Streptosporangiaceae bacterium]